MPVTRTQEEQSLCGREGLKEKHRNISCVISTTRSPTLQGVKAKKNKGNTSRYIIIIIIYCTTTSYFTCYCKV